MLRLLEHYTSPQGEGPRVGIMTQFVRFAGCNLKCPGWPCDTPQAIDPKLFRKEQREVVVPQMIEEIFEEHWRTGAANICFTGGEPMIQNQADLVTVTDNMPGFTFECFTNGTRPIQTQLTNRIAFIMDWKLPGSGEGCLDEQRVKNLDILDQPLPHNAVKFVVSDYNDLGVAQRLWEMHLRGRHPETFVGAAWGKFGDENIVEYVKENKLPWRLNVQVHNYLFGAHRRFI